MVVSDIDRGWAFAVLSASFVAQIIVFGVSYSGSIFYVAFLDKFQVSPSTTAWIVTLNTCTTYMFMPMGSVMCKYLSSRWTILIGCLISTAGMTSSAFAFNVLYIFISFSFLTGLGWSIVFVAILERLADYFRRYRSLAYATSSMGAAIGQFLYPPLLTFLFERYCWSGALVVLAGINLNLAVVAVVMMNPRCKTLAVKVKDTRRDSIVARCGESVAADLTLMKNLKFVLFILNLVVCAIGVSAFLMHVINATTRLGYSNFHSNMLISCIGVASLFGRLLLGLIAHHPKANVVILNMASFVITGISIIAGGFTSAYGGLVTISVLFGFFTGVWGLLPEMIIFVVGVNNLAGGLGIINFFIAVGHLLGGPLAAALFEMDPSYRLSFAISGSCSILGSSLLLPFLFQWRQNSQL